MRNGNKRVTTLALTVPNTAGLTVGDVKNRAQTRLDESFDGWHVNGYVGGVLHLCV